MSDPSHRAAKGYLGLIYAKKGSKWRDRAVFMLTQAVENDDEDPGGGKSRRIKHDSVLCLALAALKCQVNIPKHNKLPFMAFWYEVDCKNLGGNLDGGPFFRQGVWGGFREQGLGFRV